MTGTSLVEAPPTFEDMLGKEYADRVNKRLETLKCDKVKSGEEAIIASATFKEQDAFLAAGTLPTGTAAIGAILAASGDDFNWLTLGWTAGASLVALILLFVINMNRQTQAVATRVIDYRLGKGTELRLAEAAPATPATA